MVFDLRSCREWEQRPNLSGSSSRSGNPGGDGDRLVEVRHANQEITAELFFRFGKGSIDNRRSSVANPHAGRGFWWLQGSGREELAVRVQLMADVDRFRQRGRVVFGRPGSLFGVHQQEVVSGLFCIACRLRASLYLGQLQRIGQRKQWSDLDRALPRRREPTGDGDRFLPIQDIDDVVSSQLFRRLRIRAIGHLTLAITNTHACRRSDRMQGRRGDPLSLRSKFVVGW